jgi:hypothetical protein
VEDVVNQCRYKLYLKRAVMKAHLEVIEEAIRQHNRYVEEVNLNNDRFRHADEVMYRKFLSVVEDVE